MVLDRNPVGLVRLGPRAHEDDRRIAGHPVVDISLRASIFEFGTAITLKLLFGRLALNLDDAVGDFTCRIVPDFNIAVDSSLKPSWMPEESHLQGDGFDQVYSLLAHDARLKNLLHLVNPESYPFLNQTESRYSPAERVIVDLSLFSGVGSG